MRHDLSGGTQSERERHVTQHRLGPDLSDGRRGQRPDALGELQTFENQDRSSWDPGLVAEGLALLGRSASGASVSQYHIEAAIAAFHTTASVPSETDWRKVVQLYDALIAVAPSPVVALNRAIAIGQVEGPERGLAEMAVIPNSERLTAYPFYQAVMGELEFPPRTVCRSTTAFPGGGRSRPQCDRARFPRAPRTRVRRIRTAQRSSPMNPRVASEPAAPRQ